MPSCGCPTNTTYEEKETIRRSYEDRRDALLNQSIADTACVERERFPFLQKLTGPPSVAVSVLEYLNATYVSRHAELTLRLLNPQSLLCMHLNALSRYRQFRQNTSKERDADDAPWHPELQWLTQHPRVLISPVRIAVARNTGSLLAAHLLNVKHLLSRYSGDNHAKPPPFILLLASNMWFMRPGVEAFANCHVSSVRFGLATPWCAPDYTCTKNDGSHQSVLCRLSQLRESIVFPIVHRPNALLQKCVPEGQFHPTRLYAALLAHVEGLLALENATKPSGDPQWSAKLSTLKFAAEESVLLAAATAHPSRLPLSTLSAANDS